MFLWDYVFCLVHSADEIFRGGGGGRGRGRGERGRGGRKLGNSPHPEKRVKFSAEDETTFT